MNTHEKKSDWSNFDIIIAAQGIEYLYHFTDLRNVKSIIQHGGLYSWWSCQENGIQIPFPGGTRLSRRLDSSHGLQDYVHLNLNPNPPMLYAAKHLTYIAILEIDPQVIYWRETRFSNENATSNNAVVGDDLASFELIHFDEAVGTVWQGHAAKRWRQAEVMVRTHIPLSLITLSEYGLKTELTDIERVPLSRFYDVVNAHG